MTLNEYVRLHVKDLPAFCASIGYKSPKSIYRVLSGTRGVSRERMLRIQEATRGKVTPNDFYGAA